MQASVGDWTGRVARLLAQTPEIAGQSLATALVLGDVARAGAEIERDPEAATGTDPLTGSTHARGVRFPLAPPTAVMKRLAVRHAAGLCRSRISTCEEEAPRENPERMEGAD